MKKIKNDWVKNFEEITAEEFEKADEIVRRFWSQQDKTVQATITYNAEITVTVKIPDDWDEKKIIEELEDGYYQVDKEDRENITLKKMVELIVNGDYVKLK